MNPDELMEIHDLLDELVVERKVFREPLLATGLELGATPFFPMVVYETRPGTLYLGFSVDPALSAISPEREVQDVAAVCVEAVRFPKVEDVETHFVYGGTPPRPR